MVLRTIVHGVRLVRTTGIISGAWLSFGPERVLAMGTGDSWREHTVGSVIVDGRGCILAPGFLDMHVHGGGGFTVTDETSVERFLTMHRAHGTTRSVVSIATAPMPEMLVNLQLVARCSARDPRILGSHLEGPFLDIGRRGAHRADLLKLPVAEVVDQVLDAAAGTLRQVTLAPELPGAMSAISRFVDAGVAVGVGHTGCDYATAAAAFDHGATILTHAFNGMNGIHHRSPGPVVAALRASQVTLELIVDGHHVDDAVVGLLFAAAQGRVALITDAIAGAGLPAGGVFTLGGQEIVVDGDGIAMLRDGSSLAGSTLTMDRAVRRAVQTGTVDLHSALLAASLVPARALVGCHQFGSIDPGSPSDAVLLNADLTVRQVWSAGAVATIPTNTE